MEDGPMQTQILGFLKNPKNMLVYNGSPGTGKTYFCACLVEWCFENFSTFRYHREEDILRRLRNGISDGKSDYLMNLEYLIDDQFVMLDDVGSGINPKKVTHRDLEFRREVFFSFLDYRYRVGLPTVITSNFTRNDFKEVYSERIYSRLFASQNTIIERFGEGLDKRQMGM
jgi:DNA replication protein DnaC